MPKPPFKNRRKIILIYFLLSALFSWLFCWNVESINIYPLSDEITAVYPDTPFGRAEPLAFKADEGFTVRLPGDSLTLVRGNGPSRDITSWPACLELDGEDELVAYKDGVAARAGLHGRLAVSREKIDGLDYFRISSKVIHISAGNAYLYKTEGFLADAQKGAVLVTDGGTADRKMLSLIDDSGFFKFSPELFTRYEPRFMPACLVLAFIVISMAMYWLEPSRGRLTRFILNDNRPLFMGFLLFIAASWYVFFPGIYVHDTLLSTANSASHTTWYSALYSLLAHLYRLIGFDWLCLYSILIMAALFYNVLFMLTEARCAGWVRGLFALLFFGNSNVILCLYGQQRYFTAVSLLFVALTFLLRFLICRPAGSRHCLNTFLIFLVLAVFMRKEYIFVLPFWFFLIIKSPLRRYWRQVVSPFPILVLFFCAAWEGGFIIKKDHLSSLIQVPSYLNMLKLRLTEKQAPEDLAVLLDKIGGTENFFNKPDASSFYWEDSAKIFQGLPRQEVHVLTSELRRITLREMLKKRLDNFLIALNQVHSALKQVKWQMSSTASIIKNPDSLNSWHIRHHAFFGRYKDNGIRFGLNRLVARLYRYSAELSGLMPGHLLAWYVILLAFPLFYGFSPAIQMVNLGFTGLALVVGLIAPEAGWAYLMFIPLWCFLAPFFLYVEVKRKRGRGQSGRAIENILAAPRIIGAIFQAAKNIGRYPTAS